MAANDTKNQQPLTPREQAIRQLKVKGFLDQDGKAMGRRQFYEPTERGFEREISKRLAYWAKLRKERG